MTKKEQYEQTTEQLLEPIIEKFGFELVDVEYVREGGTWYLRVYIDKPGGITVNECADVSRAFNPVLDERDYIQDSYVFEVSSPGLGRPLKKPKDYDRSLGKSVEIHTYRPIEHKKEFVGILKGYDESTVTILEEEEQQEKIFLKKDIALIKLAFDF